MKIGHRYIVVTTLAIAALTGLYYVIRPWHRAPPAAREPTTPGFHTQKAGPVRLYPNPTRTPGAIDPQVNDYNIDSTICVPGYTKTVRPPSSYTHALKIKQMREWKLQGDPSDYEEDHLIPLELGGCPTCIDNLWPEPRRPEPGARQKDVVEDYLHKQVCRGSMTLTEAQKTIADDWFAVYKRLEADRAVP